MTQYEKLYHLRHVVIPYVILVIRGEVPKVCYDFSDDWCENSIEGFTCRDKRFHKLGLGVDFKHMPTYKFETGFDALELFFKLTFPDIKLVFSNPRKVSFKKKNILLNKLIKNAKS